MKKSLKLSLLAAIPTFSLSALTGISFEAATSQPKTTFNTITTNSEIDLATKRPTSNYFTIPTRSSTSSNILWHFTKAVDNQTMVDIFHASPEDLAYDFDAQNVASLTKQENIEIYETWNNVLSKNSINTVRNETHYFNFIKNPKRNNLIDIIATPVVSNFDEIIVINTDFTSVDDSALFINENLVFVATKNNEKLLVNYKFDLIEKINENQAKQLVLTLELKSSLNISSIFGQLSMENKKFALSPVTKTISSTELTTIALWPMGSSVSEFNNQANNFLVKIEISALGKIAFENYRTNFSATSDTEQIVNITPLQIVDDQGQEGQTKFFAITRPNDYVGNNDGPNLNIYEFGLGAAENTQKFSFQQEKLGSYERVELEKIVPYSMVRKSEVIENNVTKDIYSLFWIHQNNFTRVSDPNLTIPELITRTEVYLERAGQAFEAIGNSNIESVEFKDFGTVNSAASFETTAVPQIQQIHYALDDGFGDSAIAVRVTELFTPQRSSSDNATTAAIPTFVNNKGQDNFNFQSVNSYFESKWRDRWSIATSGSLLNMDSNAMATISNGIFMHTEIFPSPTTRNDALREKVPYVAQIPMRLDLLESGNGSNGQIDYSTSQIADTIYLPSQPSDKFIGYERINNPAVTPEPTPENPNPVPDPESDKPYVPDFEQPYNLPVKISELDFTDNIGIREGDGNGNVYFTTFTKNSALWYARYWIKNIGDQAFHGYFNSEALISFSGDTFFYKDGQLIADADPDEPTSYAEADEVKFTVLVPKPYYSGIISTGAPSKYSFTFKDNPGIPTQDNPLVEFQSKNVSGEPTNIANVIQVMGETRQIPADQSIIKYDNDENAQNAMFVIDQEYFDMAFLSATATGNDFLGTLKTTFSFMDSDGRIYEQTFNISGQGFDFDWIYIPTIGGSILLIALITLVVFLIIRKKNLEKAGKSQRMGFLLAKKIDNRNQKSWIIDEKNKTVKVVGEPSKVLNKAPAKKPAGPLSTKKAMANAPGSSSQAGPKKPMANAPGSSSQAGPKKPMPPGPKPPMMNGPK